MKMKRTLILILLTCFLIPISFASADFSETYYPTNSDYCGEFGCNYDICSYGDIKTIEFNINRYPHREINSKMFNFRLWERGCQVGPLYWCDQDALVEGFNSKPASFFGPKTDRHGTQSIAVRAFGSGGVVGGESLIFCSPQPYMSVVYGNFYSAPQNLNAFAGANSVSVNWSALSGAVTYNIYWTSSAGESGSIAGLSSTHYVHTGLVNGRTYYYTVKGQDDKGESPSSNQDSAIPHEPDACINLPSTGTWTVSGDCTLYSTYTAPGNVIVQNNSVLTIPNGITLNINLIQNNLTVRDGSGVLIKQGGKID